MVMEPAQEDAPAGRGSRAMDAAGAAAAVVLALIVADIFTDGRLISRRLARWRDGRQPDDSGSAGE